ncbi:MAG: DDE-type integrase/transposase/recombinase [Firmicutes bacterium]|nr:DDE-type integrase/transposase/recombinase [Bacillota bacterium]
MACGHPSLKLHSKLSGVHENGVGSVSRQAGAEISIEASLLNTFERVGRPISAYSLTRDGRKVPDELIKEWICELIAGDGVPYGYKKLTVRLREEHRLAVNHKKVYRLCKELDALRPQRKVQDKHPRRLAKRDTVTGPNQLWEMEMKYGYIRGADEFFFQLSLLDVFDRCVIDYHLGLSCTAADAVRVLKNSFKARGLTPDGLLPKVRTDNGPQFVAKKFEEACGELKVVHERIPVKTPNMNAHIEAFHPILEDECYSRNDFASFLEVYVTVPEYMECYTKRRRHGSLGFMAPEAFHKAFMSNSASAAPIVA